MNEMMTPVEGEQVVGAGDTEAGEPHVIGAASISWRNVFKVYPACAVFPAMSPDQLRALGEDIKANGLRETIKYVRYHRSTGQYDSCRGKEGDTDLILIDGRNRLDAMELAGEGVPATVEEIESDITQFEEIELKNDEEIVRYIISANIRRRHLSGKDRDHIIGELLKLDPSKSDRQIGREANVDHKKVGAVRHQMEDVGGIPHVDKRTDTRGRQQPAHKRLTDSQRESERRAMRTSAEALADHLTSEQPRGPTQADWQRRIQTEASVNKMVFGDEGKAPLPASATASPEPAPAPKPSTPAAHVPSSNPSAPTQARFDLNPLGATPQTPVPGAAVAAPAPDPKAKDQEAWERSVLAYMDDATKIIRMWDAAFPGWKAFDPPDHIVRAADQIAVAWTGIASLLKTERSDDAAA